MVAFQRVLPVYLIGDDEYVIFFEHLDQSVHLLLRIRDTGRIGRIVEKYRLRPAGDVPLDEFRCGNQAGICRIDEFRNAAGEFDDWFIPEVRRGRNNHLVPRIEYGPEDSVDALTAADSHQHFAIRIIMRTVPVFRSEERRVGKECRGLWAAT